MKQNQACHEKYGWVEKIDAPATINIKPVNNLNGTCSVPGNTWLCVWSLGFCKELGLSPGDVCVGSRYALAFMPIDGVIKCVRYVIPSSIRRSRDNFDRAGKLPEKTIKAGFNFLRPCDAESIGARQRYDIKKQAGASLKEKRAAGLAAPPQARPFLKGKRDAPRSASGKIASRWVELAPTRRSVP